MKLGACIRSGQGRHDVVLSTNENEHTISIAPKADGTGSSASGGELLLLAVATCYCNDLYREAAKRGIRLTHVEVAAEGEFPREGKPARNITYRARVAAEAPLADINALIAHTDTVAEVHHTLRTAVPVTLSKLEALPWGEEPDTVS
ncbi:MAG TPA: OsmC family protein [Lacunisphaera sp.]|nr:OsmC family protein [Lacunisphaera sp.]